VGTIKIETSLRLFLIVDSGKINKRITNNTGSIENSQGLLKKKRVIQYSIVHDTKYLVFLEFIHRVNNIIKNINIQAD
jgi:hypothetical protein